jgi:hypothetical protein
MLSFIVGAVASQSCNCGPPDEGDPDGSHPGADSGRPDGGGTNGGDDGFNRDAACVGTTASSTLTKRPVDIIFVIDNSGSMESEIIAVQNNINVNFAQIIGDAGLDYRVIMLSTHGPANPDESICVGAPLSGNTCNPPPQRTVPGPRYFQYSIEIGSTNSFTQILNSFSAPCTASSCALDAGRIGWREWLRPDSFKSFIEITDDNETSMTYDAFDRRLLDAGSGYFGDAGNRNYVFHSISGVGENNPVTAPWQPSQPLVTTKCTGNGGDSVNYSEQHQRLSILTGGLRFPICQYTSFDAVFQKVSESVITGARVACDFPIPTAPDGGQVDLNNMLVSYTPGDGGTPVAFGKVADQPSCAPSKYYLTSTRVFLCPQTCSLVQADNRANLEVLFQCTSNCGQAGSSCSSAAQCCSGLQCVNSQNQTCAGGPCTCELVIN